MNHFVVVFIFALMAQSIGQAQLNAYEFVVVPKKLQDFETENQYHTSTLLKHLLTENKFTAYYEGEVPWEYQDRCTGLRIDLLDESSMLRTKVVLVLKDCNGSQVFRTREGGSRSKVLKEAYDEAIREAFQSIEALNYRYEPESKAEEPPSLSFKDDVKSLEDAGNSGVNQNRKAADSPIQQIATPDTQRYVSLEPKPSDMKPAAQEREVADTSIIESPDTLLYAQPLPNGYQLVDRTPKIRMTLYASSLPQVYLAIQGDVHGLVYNRDGKWFFESFRDGTKVVEELHIKF